MFNHWLTRERETRHSLKSYSWALANIAQLVGVLAINPKVEGSIPSQGTCLDSGFSPVWGPYKRQHMFLSLFLPTCPWKDFFKKATDGKEMRERTFVVVNPPEDCSISVPQNGNGLSPKTLILLTVNLLRSRSANQE